jgi:hypothetical protein
MNPAPSASLAPTAASAQAPAAAPVPPAPTVADINNWFDALFSPVTLGKEKNQYVEAITAFENLTGYYIDTLVSGTPKYRDALMKNVRIDYVGLTAMLKRFQRDVFGLKNFCAQTQELVAKRLLDAKLQEDIVEYVSHLGLRVAAEEPRKTRIAAAFSLWMCVFRPVTFDSQELAKNGFGNPESYELFCAALNYWLASTFLNKFGNVFLGELPDCDTRLERIRHDFTYRRVCLSTLETLYGSIFRCRPEDKH